MKNQNDVVEEFLEQVRKPSRYTGNEFNVIHKDWSKARLRMLLAFPDLYEIGMSHQGLQILYHIVNSRADLLAERVYVPDIDFETLLRESGRSLFSLESRHDIRDFDILGITLPYELCYTNILTILDLAGLSFRTSERLEDDPLVIGGGPCAFHPEPIADFFDAILLGDGEEAILEIADCVLRARQAGLSRQEKLTVLSEVEGVYVPSLFQPRYENDGRFSGMKTLRPGYSKVSRRILPNLNAFSELNPPIVPLHKIIHDRLGIEIARGCTRGCRFCQAGMIYRPVRERSPDWIFERARSGIEQTGFDELALLSLSTGDYSCLSDLMVRLMDYFAHRQVSVSMPSMRVGTLTPDIMNQIKRVRKTGFTVAPEAGTERLRQVINKGITEEDLLATCESAFALGWKLIKFYFMFGLPTETQADLDGIVDLAHKALQTGKDKKDKMRKITVSVGTFVPKPHTPFQWEKQLGVEEGFAGIDYFKGKLRNKGLKLKWSDPRQSFLEGVMSRGDRRLAGVIEEAWHLGTRLDAWSEHFRLEVWRQAAENCGIDLDEYLAQRNFADVLPWQHLDIGVDPDFFKKEYDKGLLQEYTPDCRVHGCQKCGVCDLKTIKPVVFSNKKDQEENESQTARLDGEKSREITGKGVSHHFYRLHYSRLDRARFLSHLEMLLIFFRTFRRNHLELNFSQGFNPSPKVSFSPALPQGTESLAEYLVVDLKNQVTDMEKLRVDLTQLLPDGLAILSIEKISSKAIPEKIETCYEMQLPVEVSRNALEDFLTADEFIVSVVRKKKTRRLDCRPQVSEMSRPKDTTLRLTLSSEIGKAGVKPMELISAVFGLSPEEVNRTKVKKMWFREIE
ncbi:MAG: TIGR03960 family B12-binding radical SAM protein [Thermodesulfobacteriota bacterium]|nr:TIGR03960 family B12-binding radical SAM protein [Thermodesulfobacteriota bacterium]